MGPLENGRADVRIRIPPVNVLDLAALGSLAEAVGDGGQARVLVLSGLPRAFCAGVAVSDHVPEPRQIDTMLAAMRNLLEALVASPAVTVAAVSGACLGGGAEIAAACDLVVAAEDARIGFPEIRLACFPPGGAALLPLRIGEARAADWILTGRVVSGSEAAETGFASRACTAAALEEESGRLAEELLSRSPAALRAALGVLRAPRREALAGALLSAEDAYRRLAGSEDLARAVSTFGRKDGKP